MNWNYLEQDEAVLKEMKAVENVTDILARVLVNRGMSSKTADTIINNPVLTATNRDVIIGCRDVAEKIYKYMNKKDAEIWVYADYDVDGITSGYIMTDFLRTYSKNEVFIYYPDRAEEYGLDMNFCKAMVERKDISKKSILVVTVDNGTSCNTEVDFLIKNKIDVVITDHHEPKEELPDCLICNPRIDTEDAPGRDLAGCGVAFKVIMEIEALVNKTCKEGYGYTAYVKYFPIVAIGTIADMMPMTEENQCIVKVGLNAINENKCINSLVVWKKLLGLDNINAANIAWDIAPRLNSCGRMGNILKAASLFFTEDEDVAESIAKEIEKINDSRKKITKKAEEAMSKIDYSLTSVCFFDGSEYPMGIAGVVANKMIERFNKPSFVYANIGDGIMVGSARSMNGISLLSLLKGELRKKHIISYGGHEGAAGFKFNIDKLDSIIKSMDANLKARKTHSSDAKEDTIDIDATISLSMINKENYASLTGIAYDRDIISFPILAIKKAKVLKTKRSKKNPENICFTIDHSRYGLDIWAWGMGSKYQEMGEPKQIDIAGAIDKDFMHPGKFTFKVTDFKESCD